ncbi:RNA polymerase sigma factor [Bacillus tianshenii]|nr:RNA polymerase sigma factor [Bacillus tianshenii]
MSEEELIIKAKNGNRQAFQQLVEMYYPTVERFAFQLGNPHHEVDDIVQEVFLRVYRFLDQFSQNKFSTWLYKITLNVTRDMARKKSQNLRKVVKIKKERTEDQPPVEKYILQDEDDRVLHQCIQRLDEKYRLPILLFYFHDKKYDEIAHILDVRLPTVKTRMLRAKQMLKKLLKEQAEGGEHHG